MAEDLDSIVKGAATSSPEMQAAANSSTPVAANASGKQSDPLNSAPNSPSMIYLNLLILEASLRAQFLELRARRRHHTFFLTLLTLWVAFFGYQLFFAPREDGRGMGGSIYWAVEGAQKVCFMGGIITAILIWAVGIWERGIRWPRRWFTISNRGLRGFNCKLVIIRRSWYAEALSTVGFFLTYGLFSHTASSSYRHVEPALLREVEKELQLSSDSHPTLVLPHEDEERGGHEEDLAPGGDYVKLLLLPKPFSPTFRENWELYRTEYWERENERRALLRQKVKEQDRRLAKQSYGWFWWLPWRRVNHVRHAVSGAPRSPSLRGSQHQHHHSHSHSHSLQPGDVKERRRRGSSVRRSSMSSSRSQTPTLDGDEAPTLPRKASTGSNRDTSDKRRKRAPTAPKGKRQGTESRSVTPEIPSPLAKESSSLSEMTPANPDVGRVTRNSATRSRGSSISSK